MTSSSLSGRLLLAAARVFEAKQFFENMAGIIKVTSTPKQGTMFTIDLPRRTSGTFSGQDLL